MRLGSYRPPYDVDVSAKERVTLFSDQPNGDTQLLNLGTMCFTHVKEARNKCLNRKIEITFLLTYPVCAINLLFFSRLNGLTQWLPKWGKLSPGVMCDFLEVPRNQNVVLCYERSLRNIKGNKT